MTTKRKRLNKDKLYKLYIDKHLSMYDISKIENCSESFVKTNLVYYNIPIKKYSDYVKLALSKDELTREYITYNKPIKKIANENNTSYTSIRNLINRYNIPKRQSHKFKKGKDNPLWKGGKIIPASFYSEYKHGAIRRNILFDITLQDMENQYFKQNGICAISGIKLTISACRKKTKESTASLDRIDSSKPYTKDNIQWVHKRVQQMKWTTSQEEFIEWCKIIAKNNQ